MKKHFPNKETYCGIVPPLITLMDENYQFDREAYEKEIAYVLEGGVNGLFTMGSAGESVHTSREVWEQATATALEWGKARRVPVYSGAIAPSTLGVIEKCRFLESAGAEIAVVTQPFYYGSLSQKEIIRHYETICANTSLKICIYNMPIFTGNDILPETLAHLAEKDEIVAIKDTCANISHHLQTLFLLEDTDVSVLCCGEEMYLTSLMYGSQGNISGMAVSFPRIFAEGYRAALKGDVEEIRRYQKISFDLKNAANAASSGFFAMKYALNLMGIGGNTTSLPNEPLSEEEKEILKAVVEKYRPLEEALA